MDIINYLGLQPRVANTRHNAMQVKGHNIEMLGPKNEILAKSNKLISINISSHLTIVIIMRGSVIGDVRIDRI